MIDLIKVFEPVATLIRPVPYIAHIAIDIHGTLVVNGKIRQPLAEMYKFFKRENSVDAHLTSTSQKEALKSLLAAKAEPRLLLVAREEEFFEQLEEMRTYAAVINDRKPASKRVAIHIHPDDPKFLRFLEEGLYKKEPLPQIE